MDREHENRWHPQEWFSLVHHLPHSLHDLLHHEDKALVHAGISGLTPQPSREEQKPPLILTDNIASHAAGGLSLEKDIDPAIARSQHNIGLLIHDYLHTLPVYEANSKEAELLLEHWRKILLLQPERLAEAKTSYWHSDKAKEYWQEHIHRLKADPLVYSGEWDLAASLSALHPQALGARKSRQWQDLVIRQRLHKQTEYFERRW